MRYLFTVLLILGTLSSFSQDLIVTTGGDSLNCNIVKITSEVVDFQFIRDGSIKQSFVRKANVATIQKDYYISEGEKRAKEQALMIKSMTSKETGLFGFSAGYSRDIGDAGDDLGYFEDYIEDLRNGFCFGAILGGYFTENTGLGLRYNFHKHEADYKETDGSLEMPGFGMRDDISIHMTTLNLLVRSHYDGETPAFFMNLGAGIVSLKNNSSLSMGGYIPFELSSVIKAKGRVFNAEAGLDIPIGEGASFQFSGGISSGTMRIVSVNNEPVEAESGVVDSERFTMIHLTAGFRFNIIP